MNITCKVRPSPEGYLIPCDPKVREQIKRLPDKPLYAKLDEIEKIPNWNQYAYLFGYLGSMLVNEGNFSDLEEFKYFVELNYNPRHYYFKDPVSGKIIEGTGPGSISMANVSMKKLAEITKKIEAICINLGYIYDSFDEWIKKI